MTPSTTGWPSARFLSVGGKPIDMLDVRPDDIEPHELGHALSLICRYAGHVRSFYSVAQHSVLVADYVSDAFGAGRELQLAALIHDCSEGLGLGDLINPAKRALRLVEKAPASAFDWLERNAEIAVFKRFGVSELRGDYRIKQADLAVMWAEMRDLRGRSLEGGFSRAFHEARGFELAEGPPPSERKVEPWPAAVARFKWLYRLSKLCPGMRINPAWEPEP